MSFDLVRDQAKRLQSSLMELLDNEGQDSMAQVLHTTEFVDLMLLLQCSTLHADGELDALPTIVTPQTVSHSSMLFANISSLSSLSPKNEAHEVKSELPDAHMTETFKPVSKPKQRKKKKKMVVVKPALSKSSTPLVNLVANDHCLLHEVRYRAEWTPAQDQLLLEGQAQGYKGRYLAYFVGGGHSTNACSIRLKKLNNKHKIEISV